MKDYPNDGIPYDAVPYDLPLIPLRGIYMFPHMVIHFDIGRQKSLESLEEAMLRNSEVILCSQKDYKVEQPTKKDLWPMGVLASIKQTLKLPNGSTRVLVEGVDRVSLEKLNLRKRYYAAQGNIYEQTEAPEESKQMEAATRLVLSDMREYLEFNPGMGQEMMFGLSDIDDPGRLCDVIASYTEMKDQDYAAVLMEMNIYARLETVHKILQKEIELLRIEDKISRRVQHQIDQVQKEYYLKEQIQAIRKELGEDDDTDNIVSEYEEKLGKLKLPAQTKEKIEKEINRLKQLTTQSPEYQVARSYLDVIFDLPWNKATRSRIDLAKAEAILEEDHYGLKDVKEHILEYIAIRKLTTKMRSPILCLVGPPGVGKTSVAKSIARAMGRNFARMSLGGVRDEAEIRGHRKTYIGAMPGRVIQNLIQAKVNNPVFLFDEIDKMANDFRGDPASALLEVLDPEQNSTFADHYVEVPFDLSNVLFLTTANYLEDIPEPLRDRMEIIRLSGYTHDEKWHIAKRHLIPKQLGFHGLKESQVQITDDALTDMILYYTREAGVRSLERMIARALRKAARKIVDDKNAEIRITKDNLTDWIGRRRYLDDPVADSPEIGVVKGLAWTQVGGEILNIEASTMPGTGKLQLTGSLGDIMKESAQAALSYVRARHESFGIEKDFHKNLDLHIHVPEGATPKDGPSAGITIAVAIVSVLTKRPVRADIAMTGELTLRGTVLPIGGVKEKVIAASRYRVPEVFLPQENEKDLEDVPETIRENITFHFVRDINEVLDRAFTDV